MSEVRQLSRTVLDEMGQTLARLDQAQFDRVADILAGAPRVFVIGVGREGLAARGFAMRLSHMAVETHWGWDDTTPAIGAEDVLVMVNGSGAIGHLDYVFGQVQATGATTVVITGVPGGATPQAADAVLAVPASVYKGAGDLVPSVQPMGSLFEQCVQVTLDLLVLELVERKGLTFEQLAARHRNFE